MNLLFFTLHIERDNPSAGSSERRAAPATLPHRGRLRWTGLAIAGLLCALMAGCGGWILAGGDPALLAGPDWLPFATTARADDQAWLEILTQPDGASVLVDGHARGQTPLSLPVTRGMHLLGLKHPEAVDEQRQLSISTDTRIDVRLWRRRPGAVQLRPAYPGASIADAAFLADGRLALSMAVPSQTSGAAGGTPREPWVFDPSSGSLAPLLDAAATPRAPLLSVSPDGRRVAYLQPDASDVRAGTPRPPLTSVWMLASADPTAPPVRLFALAAGSAHPTAGPTVPTEVEEVHDVTWTPDSQHLLVTVQLAGLGGGYPAAPRSRLLLVDAERSDRASAQPPAIELVTLPAEIVPGSYSWAADGHWVAFLTHASTGSGSAAFVALCAVDTSAGGAVSGFRYVADLGRQADVGSVLPVAPVAWSPMSDGRLVYVAATPRISVSNPLGLPGTAGGEPGLFVATPSGPALSAEEGQRLGTGTGLMAPAWQAPGAPGPAGVLALARSDQGSKPLVVRSIDPQSGAATSTMIELPPLVGGSGVVTGRWDLARGRLLILAHHDGSSMSLLDYWLVQLQAGDEQ